MMRLRVYSCICRPGDFSKPVKGRSVSTRTPEWAGADRSLRVWRLLVLLPLLLAGCGPDRSEPVTSTRADLVWPPAPEQPRITYLGEVSTQEDLEERKSWFSGLGEVVFGEGKVGILVSPYAVAVDATGLMFVADSGGAAVHAFNLRTRAYHQFSRLSDEETLQKPVGLATFGDRVYVVDSVLHQVCVFKKNGDFLFSFGGERFKRPSGIACGGPDGVVCVADTSAHTIHVFSLNGEFIRQLGTRGLSPGQFNFPTHLWIDPTGKLYVSDTLNYRIQVFTREGRFLKMFGQQGDRPGNFAHPGGVATDRFGNVYVTDRQFENVQVFNSDGQILMAFGQEGTEPGEFWLPGGIFVDGRNRIYVADSFNKRIQIFALLEDARP